jgi:pyruvate-formate lyase-activating enzyme
MQLDEFDNFHNLPKKLADRELMLKGQWPQGGCEYCKKIEDAGGVSDRLFHLNIPDMVPKELDDAITTTITPKVVEVYFDNVCNMSCIYCSNLYSSKIQQENVKFGRYEQDGLVIDNTHTRHPDFKAMTNKFWDWMELHYADINRLQVLGGEPFYQAEFDRCMEFLYNHKNVSLEFNVVSNLMIAPDKFKERIMQIRDLVAKRKIKRFDLTASIDCWGPEQEYIRYGLNLEQWRENFEFLVSQKWITLNINQVISALSVPTIPELIKYVNQFRDSREIGHYLITVNLPSYLNPDVFGCNFFDFDSILSVMPEDTWQQREIKQYMMGVKAQINSSSRNVAELKKMKLYLDEIDRRRNLDWRTTFPWLVKELDNVV